MLFPFRRCGREIIALFTPLLWSICVSRSHIICTSCLAANETITSIFSIVTTNKWQFLFWPRTFSSFVFCNWIPFTVGLLTYAAFSFVSWPRTKRLIYLLPHLPNKLLWVIGRGWKKIFFLGFFSSAKYWRKFFVSFLFRCLPWSPQVWSPWKPASSSWEFSTLKKLDLFAVVTPGGPEVNNYVLSLTIIQDRNTGTYR